MKDRGIYNLKIKLDRLKTISVGRPGTKKTSLFKRKVQIKDKRGGI